jgi:tRNA1(Val) A37 N6-methylase TrmN6
MEILHNGFTLQTKSGFPLSTDSMLLSGFAALPRDARILDLGAGCGTLGLLLCASDDRCCVTGIEIDPAAHEAALENIRRNRLDPRMESICADIRTIPSLFPAGSFDCCISNPPYFTGGPASEAVPLARRDDCCSPEELFEAAAWALKFGGTFFLVHKPERLAQLCGIACACKLEPKRLQLIRHRPDKPVSLILLACRKGAKPGLQWEELCLFDKEGQPTPQYRKIYHL